MGGKRGRWIQCEVANNLIKRVIVIGRRHEWEELGKIHSDYLFKKDIERGREGGLPTKENREN